MFLHLGENVTVPIKDRYAPKNESQSLFSKSAPTGKMPFPLKTRYIKKYTIAAAATITIMCVLYLDQKVGFLLFCLLIKHLLCLDIPRRPSCADPLHRTGLDHGTEDGFNGRGADIGEYFANLGFG